MMGQDAYETGIMKFYTTDNKCFTSVMYILQVVMRY